MEKVSFIWLVGLTLFVVASVVECGSFRRRNSKVLEYPEIGDEIGDEVPNHYLPIGNYSGSQQDPEYVLSEKERNFRKSKFFPLFTIIRFTNEFCRTSNEEHGICFTKTQCAASGGIALGNCAQGLGVCCRFVVGCGAIITQNGTSFQSPNYPSRFTPTDGSNVCQVRIRRPHNVCQLRLNFIALDIDGPVATPAATTTTTNDAGTCRTDQLAITGSGGTIPNLCGNLNNQHMYVDFGSSDTVTLNLLLSGTVQRERLWNIEILMVPCNSLLRAPPGCLQYFTGVSGQVQSFNFQGGTHLANQDYSICVRPEDSMRYIDWMPCNPGDVKISGGTVPTMPTTCTGVGLNMDTLMISGGTMFPQPATPVVGTGIDRFCDMTFPATVPNAFVRTSVRPFILHFRTDTGEVGGANMDASIGFCLRFQQNPQ